MRSKGPNTTIWLEPAVLDRPFRIQFRDDHIHVTLGDQFRLTPDIYREYWASLSEIAEKHNCRRVLVEGVAPRGEHSTNQIIEAGIRTSAIPDLWMAYCLRDHEKNDGSELYQAIASSQSTHIKFFVDRDQALDWLKANSK